MIIAVYSAKGGVGKTTLAVNLAWASAALSGHRTLLWDLDAQGAASFILGQQTGPGKVQEGITGKGRVQLVVTPSTQNLSIPNEDARAVDLEDSNLFALNRFPGYDRWEDGSRITYGVEWSLDRPNVAINTIVGQSYRLTRKPSIFPDGTGLMAAALGLTPAETLVAGHLATGKRREEIAQMMSVTMPTVNYHLRNIFQKSGTSRQSDAMRLLRSVPLTMPLLDHPPSGRA